MRPLFGVATSQGVFNDSLLLFGILDRAESFDSVFLSRIELRFHVVILYLGNESLMVILLDEMGLFHRSSSRSYVVGPTRRTEDVGYR